jgi:hypothetical protein
LWLATEIRIERTNYYATVFRLFAMKADKVSVDWL